jgi:hypothetical protein
MAGRRAIGASLAAAIVFSSILLSNFTLVSGEQQRLHLVSIATEERALYDQAVVLTGASAIELLDATQVVLSSRTFSCSNAAAELSGVASGEATHANASGVSVASHLAGGPPGRVLDSFPGVHPFNGTTAGLLDFRFDAQILGTTPDSSVTLRSNESHVVSLPVRLSSLVAVCLGAVSDTISVLQALGSQVCNSTIVNGALSSLGALLSGSATREGFSLGLAYTLPSRASCTVWFTVRVSQHPVLGPEGPFSFSAQQSESFP